MNPNLRYPIALMIASLFSVSAAQAADIKQINPTVCQPYTSSVIDPAKLKFRADGVTNAYDTSKFVICPIHRDIESSWDTDESDWVMVSFKRSSGPVVTSNQCTLTVGWRAIEPLHATVRNATNVGNGYGSITFDGDDVALNGSYNTASLVCRIAPGSTLDSIRVYEGFTF